MPATSGSPTQIRSSVLTVLDLAGLPDDAYSAGDLAFVISVAQTFRLRRTALGSTPDGVTTVSTYTGNGYWEVFGGLPGAAVSVANIAALSLLPDNTYGDGQQVFVESVRSFFSLRNGVIAPDGITIVAALSGTKTWFRADDVHHSWDAILTWYVDKVAGNDENVGDNALLPLQTLEELTRRTYRPNSPRAAAFDVMVGAGGAGTFNASNFYANVSVTFYAAETMVQAAPVAITVAVARVQNPYTSQKVTSAGLSWASGKHLKTYVGNAIDQLGWKIYDVAGAQNATSFDATPLLTDTIAEFTQATIAGNFTAIGRVFITFYRCTFLGKFFGDSYFEFNESNVATCNVEATELGLYDCYVQALTGTNTKLGLHSTVVVGIVQARQRSVVRVDDTTFASNVANGAVGVSLSEGSIAIFDGGGARGVECYQCATVLNVGDATIASSLACSAILAFSGAGNDNLFGSGNSYVVKLVTTNMAVTYKAVAALVAAATVAQWAHSDGAGGLVTGTFAAMPGASTTLLATRLVGLFPL